MWSEIVALCMDYSGNELAVGLFFVSFVYLMIAEKEKSKRIIFFSFDLLFVVQKWCCRIPN